MKTSYLTLAMVSLAGSLAANAAHAYDFNMGAGGDPLTLGTPIYGGTGCPQGTAQATLSPDGTSLSLIFDNYQAEAGNTTGRRIDRKSCNIAIPVHVPQGLSVSIFEVDYRGFNAIPAGGMSQFNVEYFFAGQQGPRLGQRFTGPLNSDYLIPHQLEAAALVWSACGADVNLRANTSMMAISNAAMEQTIATVDTADVKAAVVYHIQWRQCGGAAAQPIGYEQPIQF